MTRYIAKFSCLFFASVMAMNLFVEAEPPSFPKAADPSMTAMQQQMASVEAMQASIDKQKAAVQAQVAEGKPAGSFFTTPWHKSPAASQAVPVSSLPCSPMAETDLAPLVKATALAENINAGVIRAVIRRESASYPCAVSAMGAVGLMQLMPATSQQFGADPLNAKQNVQAGTRYLKQLLTRYKGDLKLALAAYNAGPTRVDATLSIPPIAETVSYVDAILKDVEAANSSTVKDPE